MADDGHRRAGDRCGSDGGLRDDGRRRRPGTATAAAPEGGGTSGTNTHTEGVDEGDITETDGRYVYSIVDGTLRSVDLDTATVVSAVSAPAWATDMVLYGDRLLVAGTDWSSSTGDTSATTYAVDAGTLTSLGTTHLEGSLVSVRSIDGTARLVVSQPLGAKLPFVQPATVRGRRRTTRSTRTER